MHAVLPLVTLVGYLLVATTGQGRNLAMMIPMGLSVVVTTALGVRAFNKERAGVTKVKETYAQYLLDMRREMVASQDTQRIFYLHNYPSPDTILRIISGEESGRSGTRLWERRPSDADFGTIRLGMGIRPSTVVYTADPANYDTTNPQSKDAARLAEDSLYVSDVPITIPLRPNPDQEEKEQSGEGEGEDKREA